MACLTYPEDSIFLAPLAGYTDLAFRRACRRYGCRYAFTPLVEAGSIVYRTERTQTAMIRGEDEDWLGVQLLGSRPELIAEAARYLNDLPFDVIDFNMGCPVRKVTKRGAGAALCETADLAASCIEQIARQVTVPVTAKIRIVSSGSLEATVNLARTLAGAGIAALTIHGRTVEQVYSGPVADTAIAAVREAIDIPVIANGGVTDCCSAQSLRRRTGCDRIMIARGAIGNPWIFRSLAAGRDMPPSHQELCDILEEHVLGIVDLYGEKAGLRYARKIVAAYLCGRGYRRALRAEVTSVSCCREFHKLLVKVRSEGPRNATTDLA